MSKQLTSRIEVEAPPQEVWSVLAEFDSYSDWNPFIVAASREGSTLELRMKPQGGRAMAMKPRLVEESPGERLRWRGRLGVPGLLDAEHSFDLEADGDRTHVIQSERFTGLLVPLVSKSLDRRTLPAFEAMNVALKRRVEARAGRADA